MKIYVFGSLLVEEDRLPIQILPSLQKSFPQIVFEVVDPNENFPPKGEKDLIILDTVKGLKQPKIFNLDHLQELKKSPNSPHDYDLRMHLLLLKKLKKINSVRILGTPNNIDKNTIVDWLSSAIAELIRNPE